MNQNYRRPALYNIVLSALLISSFATARAQSAVLLPGDYLKNKLDTGLIYSTAQINRFADLGRLWGVIHYFNPKLNSGLVSTDTLALQPLRILLDNPSAAGFRKAVNRMLEITNDNGTTLLRDNSSTTSLLFADQNLPPRVHRLPDSTLLIAFPTIAADRIENPAAIHGLMPGQWTNAPRLIIDLRNAGVVGPYADYTFIYDVLPLLVQTIAGSKPLPAIFERRVFHNGFVSQGSDMPNIYTSGWQTTAISKTAAPSINPPLNKPVAFIYNSHTNIEILKQLSMLREANLCRLIFEGAADGYPAGKTETLIFEDSVRVQVRVSDFMLSGDRALPPPDLLVDRITDTSVSGTFIRQVISVLENKDTVSWMTERKQLPAFQLPRPDRYADTLVPSADKRMFGLYNFWNAFHYFSPYKETLDHSWDKVIHKYVPVFLNADDSLSYMLAVRSLASETQDCHGFVNTIRPATPARKFYGAWPPVQLGIVNHKLHIVELAKDSSQDLSQLKIGDEVTHVDGHSFASLKEQWRKYIPTSNESTYERDVANYLTVGPLHSHMTLTLMRNNTRTTVSLKRNARWNMGTGILNFNTKHKTMEDLPGNVGYINMGSLGGNLVDSAMKRFANSKAIIFDIRNYPKGTAWSIAPQLTDKTRKAVMFDKPFVNYEYLSGSEEQSTMKSFFTVTPAVGKAYKGRIVILCNATTQSQAEYSIMMFQGATNAVVIGSQTAGADGNITEVTLPGGYSITFSGLGIYYPDGTPTQRQGIRVDIQSKPTIKGLLAGKDEVLERALKYVSTGK